MKVLIIGGGGREHAVAWSLSRSPSPVDLICAPGNPGIAELAQCRPVKATDVTGLVDLVEETRPGLVVVGPEA
ncbi:MAG: phosphoribosylamine--glycine ligase, partial [Actinomycetota bacterium]